MSRLNKANEIIELAILMQNSYGGLTLDDIAHEFECSRRSAERMKAVLVEKFGNKIEEVYNNKDKKKRWRFKKGTMNWLINFTPSDFANLELCKKSIKSPTKQKEIDELIEKIKALNPQNVSNVDVDEILSSQAYAVRQGFRENIKLETLQIINDAILCQKQIVIKYADMDKEFILNPYGILHSDRVYLIAYNPYVKAIWTYRISKIKEIKLTDNYFDKDESFSMEEYCGRSFGVYQGEIFDVILQFDKDSAEDVKEYFFHPTQKGKLNDDGSYTLSLKASGEFEIITEILKWRSNVKIIAPQSLKDTYNKTIQEMYKQIKE